MTFIEKNGVNRIAYRRFGTVEGNTKRREATSKAIDLGSQEDLNLIHEDRDAGTKCSLGSSESFASCKLGQVLMHSMFVASQN